MAVPPATDRLAFREMDAADLDVMFGLLGDPVVVWVSPRPHTRDEVRDWIDNRLAPQLQAINGIAGVESIGGQERELEVIVVQQRLLDPASPRAARALGRLAHAGGLFHGQHQGDARAGFAEASGLLDGRKDPAAALIAQLSQRALRKSARDTGRPPEIGQPKDGVGRLGL